MPPIKNILICAPLIVGTVFSVPVTADGGGVAEAVVTAATVADVIFNQKEREIFQGYHYSRDDDYGEGKKSRHKSLPPGLKKKLDRGGELPPGWQKKVARGEVLEYDLYRMGHRLPEDILRRLPVQPQGTSLLRLDDRIVRIADETRMVMDIFEMIAR